MVAFCLPKADSARFLAAVTQGQLHPAKLIKLSSEGRREEIAKVIGDDMAKDVNALFEKKLLLEHRREALFRWVQEVAGSWDKDQVKNAETKINNLDERILNPENEKAFLGDLASQKLGFTLKPEQAKIIFDKAQEAKVLREEWEKTLGQQVPRRAVNDPVTLTRLAYGRSVLDLQDTVESMKPSGKTFIQHLLDVVSVPKTLATGVLHLSALGVQGWGMISHKVTWEAAVEQFKYFYDEENYKNLMAYIISHPDYEYARQAKLGLTDVTDQLSTREEAIQSTILQNLNTYVADKTGLPINVLGASSRAFTGFLNYTRFNRFTDLLNAARNVSDVEIRPKDQIVQDLAKVVNDFTGRASLGPGERFANTQAILNAVFFAPRKVLATVNMFNPGTYLGLYLRARESGNYTALNASIRQLTGSIMATGAVLYTANMMGYSVDYNPASANFLKIQTPSGEKLDITGGNAIWIRLIGRIILDKEITAHGKEIDLGEGYKPTTRADLLNQYVRGKLAPATGVLADWMYGKDAVGRPFSLSEEARSRMEPILMSSMMQYYYQQPDKAMSDIPVLAAMFGVQAESPVSRGTQHGLTPWGEPDSSFLHDPVRTPLDASLDHIGYTQDFPSNTINGVKLTDDQQKQYIALNGQMAKARLSNLVESPWYQNLSDTQKLQRVKQLSQMSKTLAQTLVTAKSIGTDNNIFQKSMENKRKQLLGIEGNENESTSFQQDSKKTLNESLKQPIRSEEDLKKQWSDLMIKDYDFGRMKETNPLAFLGYQAIKEQGIASYFKTPTSALGLTNTDNANPKAGDYSVVSKIMKEAGIDPKSAKGKIMLGPEFGEGKNTYTLEHELMHRGMMELLKTGFKQKIDDHLMIQGFQHLYGNDKHSTELEEDMMGNPLKPQFKNDEKKHKEFAEIFKDDIDDIQNRARKLVDKGK